MYTTALIKTVIHKEEENKIIKIKKSTHRTKQKQAQGNRTEILVFGQ